MELTGAADRVLETSDPFVKERTSPDARKIEDTPVPDFMNEPTEPEHKTPSPDHSIAVEKP